MDRYRAVTLLAAKPKADYAADTFEVATVNWQACSLVEMIPGKVSGVPLLKGTRVQADSIVENYRGGSPIAEISENFAIPESTISQLLDFAATHTA